MTRKGYTLTGRQGQGQVVVHHECLHLIGAFDGEEGLCGETEGKEGVEKRELQIQGRERLTKPWGDLGGLSSVTSGWCWARGGEREAGGLDKLREVDGTCSWSSYFSDLRPILLSSDVRQGHEEKVAKLTPAPCKGQRDRGRCILFTTV